MSDTRPKLLLVDDEARILRSLRLLFSARYQVCATTDVREALAIVGRESIDVVISDQRMPQMRGAELLRQIRERDPRTMRILLTGYSEMDAVVASVNEGEIFRFISKPWDAAELRRCVEEAATIARSSPQMASSQAQPLTIEAAETVLVIGDDAALPSAVRRTLGEAHPVAWARSLEQAFDRLAGGDTGVIVSELSVAGESLTTALKMLKAEHPDVVTIVTTPFEDIRQLIGLINQGQVYRLLPRPVGDGPLGMNIRSAVRHHRLLRHSPAARARHRVEHLQQSEEPSMAGRVKTLLSRLRGRSFG